MQVFRTVLPGVLLLRPRRFLDERGFFAESYNRRQFEQAGIATEFVQDNLSFSENPFTLRGLHFQRTPFAQAKLVSVIKGRVRDVVVDLRRSSLHFAQHLSIQLSAAEGDQLFVPEGFAHGFLTLEPETLFAYKVSTYYSREHEEGICFDDPVLNIDWGIESVVTTSIKDRAWSGFDPQAEYFE